MRRLLKEYKPFCESRTHDVTCYCYKMAEAEFKNQARNQSFWKKYYNSGNINWSGIKFPAGLEDAALFSDNNPQIHLRAYLIYGSSAVNVFVGPRTRDQKYFVDIVFSEFHSFEDKELKGHWYPVLNLSEFTAKILRKKDDSKHIHKRYQGDTCEKCLLHSSLPKYNPGEHTRKDASDPDSGIRKYKDIYCPYPVPDDDFELSIAHRNHRKVCGSNDQHMYVADSSPTMVTTPDEKFFCFSNWRQTIDDRFTGIFDLETFNEKLKPTCLKCELLISSSSSHTEKNKFYRRCLKKHKRFHQNSFKCAACSSNFRSALISNAVRCVETCDSDTRKQVLGNCSKCFKKIEKSFDECNHHKTLNIKSLNPSGYSFILFDNYLKKIALHTSYFQESKSDMEPVKHFMNYLRDVVVGHAQIEMEKEVAPLILTESEQQEFDSATICYCCHANFRETGGSNSKVRDHCHVLGTYRGAACKSCNRVLTLRPQISILAHNFTGFDGHLVVREMEGWDGYHIIPRNSEKVTGVSLVKKLTPIIGAIDCLEETDAIVENEEGEKPKKKDKYLTFVFKDSLSFLGGTLDRNTKLLADSDHEFEYLKNSEICQTDGFFDEEKFQLLVRKGTYPYDSICDHSDLQRTKYPEKEEFRSSLGVGKDISDEDWEHGLKVWKKFECQTMLDYSDIYVKLDTILLLEAWRPVCELTEKNFGLHPAHFYTLPSLALACCLKLLHKLKYEKIELLQNMDMIKFVSAAKRGGITSTLGTRLVYSRKGAEDVKKALDKLTDQNIETIKSLQKAVDDALAEELTKDEDYVILYLDANNLYGLAQSLFLPHSKYEWASKEDVKLIQMFFDARACGAEVDWDKDMKIFNEGTGLFIEADIEIPDEVKDKLENFPPAPHKAMIKEAALSEYAKNLLKESGEKYMEGEKLCLTLEKKEKYITHYKLMDLYSSIGAKIKNITRCLKFKQMEFLKPWVDFNTKGRMAAARLGNEIKKNFHKLNVNSVYGKFGENVLNQVDMSVVHDVQSFNREIINPYYKSHHILSENCVMVEKYKDHVQLNKPVQISSAILELAKLQMYNYYYKVLKPKFKERVELVYTDTDSFVLRLKTKNIEKDYKKIEETLDTSNFPQNHPLRKPERASQLGFFKSETGAFSIFYSSNINILF